MGNYLNDHPTSYRNLRHVYTTFTWLFHAISNQLDQLHPRQPQKNRLLPRCTLKGIFVMMLLGWTATARCAELKPGNTCDARWLYTVSTPSCRKSRHKKKMVPMNSPFEKCGVLLVIATSQQTQSVECNGPSHSPCFGSYHDVLPIFLQWIIFFSVYTLCFPSYSHFTARTATQMLHGWV